MNAYRSSYNVTLAPAQHQSSGCCNSSDSLRSPNNLTGSYNVPSQDCFQINRIYQGNGGVCQKVMRDCMCVSTVEDQKRIDDFCGPSATPGFYRNGSFWSIS
jgi:hypothetical protein